MKSTSSQARRAVLITAGTMLCALGLLGLAEGKTAPRTETVMIGQNQSQASAPPEHLVVNAKGLKVAPLPAKEFRHASCSQDPVSAPATPSLVSVPLAHLTAPLKITDDLLLPDAPAAAWYSESAPLGSKQGTTIIAGHVDYAPGVKSTGGGELSPFGHLHTLSPCTHIFVTAADGTPHAYVLTDLYTVGKNSLEDTGIFTLSGRPRLVLVTCSGESVKDAGGRFQFHYQFNLIAETQPIRTVTR